MADGCDLPPPRIAFMAPYPCSPLAGGVSRFVLELSRSLTFSGVDSIAIWQSSQSRSAVRLVVGTFSVLRASPIRPKLLHLMNGFPVSLAAAAVARLMSVPVVVTHHGQLPPEGGMRRGMFRASEIAIRVLASATTAVDSESQHHYRTDYLIPNGVDIDRFSPATQPSNPQTFRFLFLGRLAPNKGLQLLVRAAALLAASHEFEVRIVGPDPANLGGFLESLASSESARNYIRIAPPTDDPVQEYRSASGFVFPTTFAGEGLPMALLEAMASGLPVIVPNLPQYAEIIKSGRNGLVFRFGDPEDLAVRMEELIANPKRAAIMGMVARDTIARNYSLTQMRARYVTLYESLLHRQDERDPRRKRSCNVLD